MSNPVVDAHHHFWRYDPHEYAWIDGSMDVLRRDYLPEELAEELAVTGIDRVVSVQARQTLAETEWLLALADEYPFIAGVVGWVALAAKDVERHLERLAPHPFLKGIRHVLHDEPDDAYMLRPDFNRGVGRLTGHGLVYDVLIFERHLPQTLRFVDRHPEQVFVIDHVAKPRIEVGALSPWREHVTELARREHCYCKLSGMVTEADWARWTPEQLRPYFDVVLEAFGPQRLLFGSDWPVCRLAASYATWHRTVRGWIEPLAPSEQARIFGGTAVEAYGLDPSPADVPPVSSPSAELT